uniref:Tc1-like transposase DDE domain-containing protein n=2 Tax=Hucho hucho TaxID=62062 RepID=A0A4W5Q6M7_9TELE
MFQFDNVPPHFARICTQFLEAENVPVLPWPAYSPDMSLFEHIWDALDRCVRQRVPVPANIQQLCIAEWGNIPQATINSQINSMRRRCVALHESEKMQNISRSQLCRRRGTNDSSQKPSHYCSGCYSCHRHPAGSGFLLPEEK